MVASDLQKLDADLSLKSDSSL